MANTGLSSELDLAPTILHKPALQKPPYPMFVALPLGLLATLKLTGNQRSLTMKQKGSQGDQSEANTRNSDSATA